MKVEVHEEKGCYGIALEAETMHEAAILTRFGLNYTKDIRHISTYVSESGIFHFSLVLGKRVDSTGNVR